MFAMVPLAAAQRGQLHEFDVPASALSTALLRFGQQSGLQLNVASKLTDGKRSGGVRGAYTVERGLETLLAGSGLTYRFTGPRTVVIETLPDVGSAHMLGPLRIEGAGAGTATAEVNGVNGSGDVTATEGTGSYTSGALNIASKMPLSIKDTAQSVSVITQQRIIEQNISDFDALMEQGPGIVSVVGTDGPMEATYYSRGFQIQRVQIDGGAPMDIANSNWGMTPLFDMSIYDHAEILRGADGLFNGFGNAGGVISLQRKRPLDHFQLVVEGQAGSWDNYRSTIDVTGPLALNGRLRGRAVATWNDQDYFYDVATNRKELLFGTVDFDLTPSTLVSLGFTRTLQKAVPATSGLPRYQDGADIGFSRDTCLCVPWARYNVSSTETFLRMQQLFGDAWELTANVTHAEQDSAIKYGSISGTINPITLSGSTLGPTLEREGSEQLTGDLVLNGAFQWFGFTQHLVVSAAIFDADGAGKSTYSGVGTSVPVNVLDFDPYDPAYADTTSNALLSSFYPTYEKAQRSLAANLRLTFWEPLHLEFGIKYNYLKRTTVREAWCASTSGCTDSETGQLYVAGELIRVFPYSYSDEEYSWPPSIKLIYDLTTAFSAYVSYTDIYEEQTTKLDLSGNMLGPITGANYEAGLKWEGRDGRLNGSLSIYRIEQDGEGVFVRSSSEFPNGSTTTCCYDDNSDYTKVSKGVDLELTGEVLPGWNIAASYTWNDNVEKGEDAYTEGEPLESRFPKHLIKLWSSYRFQSGEWLRRLTLSAGVNAKSRAYYAGTACLAYSSAGSCTGGYADFEFEQGFYAVTSARMAYQISDRWLLSLNVDNLLDRHYWQSVQNSRGGNWYGEPRSYTLAVRGKF